MENNNNAGKKRALLIVILLLLIVCVTVTATILFFRLSDFSEGEKDSVIDIVPTGDPDPAPTEDDDADNETVQDTTANTDPMATADPSFIAFDENVTWSTNTEVEIFRVSYENGEQQITVLSENGDKVIAPGTDNAYTFWLKNTGNIPITYTVWMEAIFSNEEAPIPVQVKVSNSGSWYYIGSETVWEDVMRLNDFSQTGELSVNNYAAYTLDWQWPFESGDDEYDTYLGNLGKEEDVTLTIKINTVASADADAVGGTPTTGDQTPVTLLWVVLVLSLGLLVLVLFLGRKKKPDEEEVSNI